MSVLHGLNAPPPFLMSPGEPAVPWKLWVKMFENYALAVQSALSEDRKIALLLTALGTEGNRIYYSCTFPEGKSDKKFADVVSVLADQFDVVQNPLAFRYELFKREQGPNESIEQFVAGLREIVKNCEYKDNAAEAEAVRDQLVFKCRSPEVRKALLKVKELTLQKAIEKARNIEAVARDMGTISDRGPESDVPGQDFNAIQGSRREQMIQSKFSCLRCGGGHKANDVICPAVKARCHKCKNIGHYKKYCLRKSTSTNVVDCPSSGEQEEDVGFVSVLSINVPSARHVNATIKLGENIVHMIIDSGAPTTLMSKEVFDKLCGNQALSSPKFHLRDAQEKEIPCYGMFNTQVGFKGKVATIPIHVTSSPKCLLGVDALKQLEMSVHFSPKSVLVNIVSAQGMPMVKGYEHRIVLKPNAQPVQQRLRPLPFSVRDKVAEKLNEMLEQDIIERVEEGSDWISPIVVATRKKSDDIRLCIDLREVNKQIVSNKYPIPNMDELLLGLSGSNVFTCIDLSSAYLHVPLTEDSRVYTTFVTHEGVFRFKRLCFGLASAPSFFQEMMKRILKGINNAEVFIDDIICHGKTQEECRRVYQVVKKRLEDANLSVNAKKCKFDLTKVKFLGKVISGEGVEPDQSSVQALCEMPAPTSREELKSFLGCAGWHRSFVPNFASVVQPLTTLLSPKQPFVWSPECEEAFVRIKENIVQATSLKIFDPNLPTVIECDASNVGLGASMLQVVDGKEVPVAYISRSLNDCEKRYAIGEKEALCISWCVSKWHKYLWGAPLPFIIRTDHRALVTLLSSKGNSRQSLRISRWNAKLMPYNYTIEYKKGSENCVSDCLSRLPLETTETDDTDFSVCTVFDEALSREKIAEATKRDLNLQKLVGYLQSKTYADEPFVKGFSRFFEELSVVDDCVFRLNRFVLPESLQKEALNLSHEGHQGMSRCKQRLREFYFWPGMDMHIENLVRNCVMCQSTDKPVKPFRPPLQSIPFPSKPWSKLGLDIVGPFDILPPNQRFLVTLVDYHSKWPEVAFMSKITSSSIIDFLKSVFAREGFCDELQTDNGPQLVSEEFESFLRERNITHKRSAPYNPQCCGEIERLNQTLKHQIVLAKHAKQNVPESLRNFLFMYRSSRHATTNYSPSELLHGRVPRTKLSPFPCSSVAPIDSKELEKHVAKLQTEYERV